MFIKFITSRLLRVIVCAAAGLCDHSVDVRRVSFVFVGLSLISCCFLLIFCRFFDGFSLFLPIATFP